MKISINNTLTLALLSRCKDQLRPVLTGLYTVLKSPKSERPKTGLRFRSFVVLGICVLNWSWSGLVTVFFRSCDQTYKHYVECGWHVDLGSFQKVLGVWEENYDSVALWPLDEIVGQGKIEVSWLEEGHYYECFCSYGHVELQSALSNLVGFAQNPSQWLSFSSS